MGKAIFAIDAFPEDAQLWRIDWIGGVAYNASVPSEPLIDVCLARLPKGTSSQSQIIWEIQSHLIWNLTVFVGKTRSAESSEKRSFFRTDL